MLISIIILFIIDLYKDNNEFSLETIDWTFTKFHRNVPYIEVKNSSSLQKSQACGAIQVLKRL